MQVWLVGEGLKQREQMKARKGTTFIPYFQFPPKKVRKDCYYHTTPAMVAPKSLENLHSCEVISTGSFSTLKVPGFSSFAIY